MTEFILDIFPSSLESRTLSLRSNGKVLGTRPVDLGHHHFPFLLRDEARWIPRKF